MKNWLTAIVVVSLTCGSALPVYSDSTNLANDYANISSDTNTPTVGVDTDLHFSISGSSNSTSPLQIQTSLGTLNGQGSSISLTPDASGAFPSVALNSKVSGQATVNVYEEDVLIGSKVIYFQPGPVGNITVQASPQNAIVGGSATITISVSDIYGNPVNDGTSGSSFAISTTQGSLALGSNSYYNPNLNTLTVSTHNGVAQVVLLDNTVGTATVNVADTGSLNSNVRMNGNYRTTMVTIPITFNFSQSVTITPVQDFNDNSQRPEFELESERELAQIGVVQGDTNHNYYPQSTLKRSEFAEIVAQYMGLGTIANNLKGSPTKFADVDTSAWYDGAVAAISSLGYVKGDGTNFYPENSISYAEVAQVLLNNLGVQTTGTWPDKAISGGQTYGLFKGLGSFAANDAATRGDVAIMVRNALHLVPSSGNFGTTTKTLEAETLGYTWYGDDQTAFVTAVPGAGFSAGNEMQVQTGGQMTTLHLANTVQVTGATSLNGLLNKNIKYLTNGMGLVTYIEVEPE